MSDTPPDRPASTTPVNEQDPPDTETGNDEPSPSPSEPVGSVEIENDALSSTPPQPVEATDGAESQVPDEEPVDLSPVDTAGPPRQHQDPSPVPIPETPTAPVAEEEVTPQPAAAEPATPEPASPQATPAEPATGTGAPAALPQDPPAAPEAPRPVFDPAPPPPRNDIPAETPAPTASDAPATPPGPGPVPIAGSEPAAEPHLGEGAGPAPSPRSPLARRWPLLLLPLVVIAVVVAAFAVKSNTDKAVDKVKTKAAFVTFNDKEKGFSIKYPATWKRVGRPSDEVRLLVKDEGLDSLLVRVVPTPAPFPADLTGEEAKQVADVVLKRETFAPERILREQPVNVNGAPGYYYLYTFDEEVKGEGPPRNVQGVHAHYIVFSGRRIFILVFQALPTANFDKLAPTFDAMAESFKITPLASDAPDPTTAPDPAAPAPAPAPAPTDTSAPAPAGQ